MNHRLLHRWAREEALPLPSRTHSQTQKQTSAIYTEELTDLPEVKRVIAPKALDRFKRRIREITRRAKGISIQTTIKELASYMRGWRSYFGFCETPDVLVYLTRWVRLRLRAALWRQWKTPRRRRAALLALGVRPRLATNTAGSGHGPWYLAKSKALSVGLSNAYFKSLGLPTLIDGC